MTNEAALEGCLDHALVVVASHVVDGVVRGHAGDDGKARERRARPPDSTAARDLHPFDGHARR